MPCKFTFSPLSAASNCTFIFHLTLLLFQHESFHLSPDHFLTYRIETEWFGTSYVHNILQVADFASRLFFSTPTMSTQDEAKPTPVPINFNKSRPRFQVTIRRLACLAYAFTIFLLILIGLILAFPISVFLEPSPYKSIYFKGDASKEPHRVIKPLFDKATKFNVHSTLWKDWTGVPSSRKIEEMGGPKARPGEDVEEIGFVCGGDKEGCWLKQYRSVRLRAVRTPSIGGSSIPGESSSSPPLSMHSFFQQREGLYYR